MSGFEDRGGPFLEDEMDSFDLIWKGFYNRRDQCFKTFQVIRKFRINVTPGFLNRIGARTRSPNFLAPQGER